MTREELASTLQAVNQALDDRVEIWIQVVEADGTPAERIYRGSFQRSGSHSRLPQEVKVPIENTLSTGIRRANHVTHRGSSLMKSDIDDPAIATVWIQTLAARGVEVSLRNNRLWLHPSQAYYDLSDAELLTLRHHREAIKNAVLSGAWCEKPVVSVRPPPSEQPGVSVRPPRAISAPPSCVYCRRTPCVGPQHPAYPVLHQTDPAEVERQGKEATKVMLKTMGPRW